ncbi:unnamed protein product [Clonostachys solani]|uniref:NmrA-like domain-containing protein n=1 Tax=Clonostachys solani TaxID=160281 RepID=A0A9N9YWQ9_9HYPO|nr:unnamed protein product [Clonostachys solani]
MPPIKNVAVFGASGRVGKVVVPALRSAGFSVTAIARPDSDAAYPSDLVVKRAAYDDFDSLVAILRGHHAIVEAFNPAAAEMQTTIVKAALAAGVSHLITPDFSSDTFNPHASEIMIFGPKLKAQKELERLTSSPDCPLSWTAIITNGWYDWAIDVGVFWINKVDRTISRFGSGDQKYAMSRLEICGEATVAVLQEPEKFRNRPAYFAHHTVSNNDIISIIREIIPQEEWKVLDVPVKDFLGEGLKLWHVDTEKGVTNRLGTKAYEMLGTIAIFDEDNRFGGDFGEKAEPDYDAGLDSLKQDLRRLLTST